MLLKILIVVPLITIFINNNIKNILYIRKISITNSILLLLLMFIELLKYNQNIIEYQNRSNISLFHFYNLFIGLDPLNISLLLLTIFIIPLLLLFKPEKNIHLYYNSIFIIEFILLLMFLSIDLLLFYSLYELILIPMFILIINYGSINKNIEAAYKFFIFTLFGSLFMLISLFFIYISFKTFNFQILEFILNKQSFFLQSLLFFSFILSFLIKIPTWPFHIWLPFAHVQAPTTVSVLLASILLKIGVYGILRFNFTFFININYFYSPFIILLALLSIYFSLIITIRLIDLKQIIAYSSIIHMNLFLIGLYTFNNISIQGSLLSLISHGLISGLLFLLIGLLYNRYHSRIIFYFRGLAQTLPLFSIFFILSILANISIPISSSFIGEYLILYGIFNYNIYLFILIFITIILSCIYSLWLNNRILFGQLSKYLLSFNDLTLSEFLLLLPLLFFTYFFGLFPSYILNYFYIYSIFIL